MIKKIREKAYKTLRWSEKYTKTDMIYLAKGGFWLTAKQLSVSINAFIISIFLTRLITKEMFGVYKYAMSIFGILTITSLSGSYTAIVQAASRGHYLAVIKTFWERIKIGLIGMIGAILVGLYYLRTDHQIAYILFAVAIFVPIFDPLNSYDAVLVGKKEFKKSTILQFILQTINLLSIVAVAIISKNILAIILAYYLSLCITKTILNIIILKQFKDPDTTKEAENILKYSKHLSVVDIFNTIVKYIDKILVFQFIGPSEMAIYVIATGPLEYASSFIGNISSLSLPKFAQYQENKEVNFIKKFVIFSLLILIITALYWVVAPIIYKLLFPTYIESINLSRIFSLSLFTAAAVVPLSYLQAQKKIKALYRLNFFNSVISVLLLVISMHYGILGVIIGRVISRIIGFIITIYLYTTSSTLSTTATLP